MRVNVRYFAEVRELVDLREEVVDLPSGSTVKALLDHLAAKHGEKLKEYLLDEAGNPKPYLQFLIDEKSVSETGGVGTVLKDRCQFAIIPPVGGG